MSIWIDLLFLHGHFATARTMNRLLTTAAPEEAPSVPASEATAEAAAIARSTAPAAEAAVIVRSSELAEADAIARSRTPVTDDALSERLAAPMVVHPGAFTRPGVFVSDPVAIEWPSAPVHHPLRVLGQLS
jgi:hypothetical protein